MPKNDDRSLFTGAKRPEDIVGCRVIIDANALMSPFQWGFNLDKELQRVLPEAPPIIPASVIRELSSLAGKGQRHAKAAMDLARRYEIADIKGRGDAPVFNLALKKKWPVMTLDRGLREKLLERGIPVVILRGKGHLEVMEP